MIEDVFSRKVVGWEIYPVESGEHAADLVHKAVMKEHCFNKPIVLHSDNGSPMKSATLLSKMQELGITPSRGRPRVSNDNAYSESLFKTMKYKPDWPVSGFENIDAAREWVARFVTWYNTEHCHSGIQFVPPTIRHNGEDQALLAKRREVYESARLRNPRRWSGNTRDWKYQDQVTLNPEKNHPQELEAA
jgi:putative transposase